MKAILSIKPEFVEKIISGEKHYEYRRKIFKQDIESVIIYATKPIGMFVGEFIVEDIIRESPSQLWKLTCAGSGIKYDYFEEYFLNRNEGFALKISNLDVYEEPINPKDIIPNFSAPQSFCYTNAL